MYDEEINRIIYYEIGQLNFKLVNENYVLNEEILNLINCVFVEFNVFLIIYEVKFVILGLEIVKQKMKLNNLNNMFFMFYFGDISEYNGLG